MANRVVAFVRRSLRLDEIPEPSAIVKSFPGASALFMDENEREILYRKPWPHLGCPVDERTNSTTWMIEGHLFGASHRDAEGNWIFRRCVR